MPRIAESGNPAELNNIESPKVPVDFEKLVQPLPTVTLFGDPYARLLSKGELAEYLNKSKNSVDRLRKKRVIPFLVVGGSIRFRLADVEKALARYQYKEVSL